MSDAIRFLSDQTADAVEHAATATLTVFGRRRRPATGTVWVVDGGRKVIVTASHVIERDEHLFVATPAGKVPATLLGRDLARDIAILDIEGDLPGAIGTRDDPRVGALVLAIGHLVPGQIAASLGVIESTGALWRHNRPTTMVLHSGVTMLPGFSGGALIDSTGTAFGINTSGLAHGSTPVTIPTTQVTRIANEIVRYGAVRNGWIGITSQPVAIPETARESVSDQESALLIVGIAPESPAATAGLIVGDMLVALGDHPTADASDLQHILGGDQIDQPLAATILRGGVRQVIDVTPTVRPDRQGPR
jgi:S1-C subfamily serine protease